MIARRAYQLLVTCEHASRAVPPRYARLFASREARALLDTHRAWDPGALPVARALARAFGAPLVVGSFTRLFVDLNRSPHHPRVFSEFTRSLPRAERLAILAAYHEPHHQRVLELARDLGRAGPVLHLAIHSFTPVLDGQVRATDLGLLYDPTRARELRVALALQEALRAEGSPWTIHRNAPYRGASDGLATRLRKLLRPERYVALELELNQKWPSRGFVAPLQAALERVLAER